MSIPTSDVLCDQASVAERSGNAAKALELYKEALLADGKHYRSLLLGTNLLTMLGERREATTWAERTFASDSNNFSRLLLVEALTKEVMDSAAVSQGALIDYARLLWLGVRLIQLREAESAKFVLEFVRSMGGEDASRLAGICLTNTDSPSDAVCRQMMTWFEAGLLSAGAPIPPGMMADIFDIKSAVGAESELTLLRAPKNGGGMVWVALGMDKITYISSSSEDCSGFRPPIVSALAAALEGDTLGAAGELFEYLKDPSPLDFGVYGGMGDPRETFSKLFSYPVLDFTPQSALRHASKHEALEYMLRCYHGTPGPSPQRLLLIESLALGLCRWYGKDQHYELCVKVIEDAFRQVPFAMHLKAAQFTALARLSGEKIAARFDKFVGEDSGYLKNFVCQAPFTRFDIDQNGGARLCCGHWMPMQIGSVMEHDPLTLVNSSIAKKIKRSVMEGDYRYCNHLDCMAMVGGFVPSREQLGEEKLANLAKDDYTSTGVEHVLFAFDQSCNLSCPSCRKEKIVEKSSLSQRKMEVMETKIAPMLQGLKKLDINPAGELFASKLSRRMLSLVDPEKNPDLVIDIISNGTLFNEENWNDLANIHKLVGVVRVSVDGATKPTFEKLRRLAAWEEFIENMKFLRELRRAHEIQSLRYSFTYQMDNFREMEDFVHFGRELGCDSIIFEKLQNMGAYSVAQYQARAVHRPEHTLNAEYLAMISRDVFYDPRISRDFERPDADRRETRVLAEAV